jgi:DNA-binding transcriptional ArsR family regulator
MTPDTAEPSRLTAIAEAARILDDPIFAALQEPARIAVLRRLMELGRADISAIAEGLPQERSVVSRHLGQLRAAGLVRDQRVGRQRYYEVDGPAIVARLEAILEQMRRVARFCCP